MSQNILIQGLHSPDPKRRFAAVKEAARSRDISLLDLLREMAASDPDEQVRQVAAKAQAYIQGEGIPDAPPASSDSRPRRPVASGRVDEALASSYINQALDFQTQGKRARALKALSRALEVNPGLRHDSYYLSVLSSASGRDSDEALAMLEDHAEIKRIDVSEKHMAKEKRRGGHQSEVSKTTWVSAFMDLAIYTLISAIGTLLLVLITGQSAANLLASDEMVDYDLWLMAHQYSSLGMDFALISGLIAGVTGLIGMIIQLAVTHLAARFLFGGVGTLAHLTYRVVSLYNTRLPVLFFLTYVFIVLTFSGDMGIIPLLVLGVTSLVSLAMTFSAIQRVGEAYDFGTLRGCLSVIMGGLILGVILFAAQLALLSAIVALLPPGLV